MQLPIFNTLNDWQTWLSGLGLKDNTTFAETLSLRHFHHLEAAVGLALLPRFKEMLHPSITKATLHFSWLLNPKASPLPQLSLAVHSKTPVELVCQRCLAPMPFMLESHSSFWIAPDETQIEALSLSPEEEVFFYNESLELLQLIEDEALLTLPYSPRHPENQCKMGAMEHKITQDKPHPFAALAQLKKSP
jgi:uncharacterized protein